MRIGTALRLTGIVLACLICAVPAAAAPGEVAVAIDHAADAPDLITGRWFDLVATVDPGTDGVRLDGLEVTAESGARAETGAAVLSPGHDDGVYRAPFVVRVPVRLLEGGATEATVTVAGTRPDGTPFEASGATALRAWGSDPAAAIEATRIDVSAGLAREPAVVGEANAVRVRIAVQPGWHVYGAQVEIGVPTAVTLLAPGPERAWEGGGTVVPDGDHLDGVVTVDIPFTPVRAGTVDTRVSVLHMPCTEQMCDPVGLLYAPVSFPVVAAGGGAEAAPGAGPEAELALDYDGADLSMMLYPGEPLDLLVTVTPSAPLAPGALALVVEADGARVGEPVFPPPAGGAERYEGPFTVRVPFTAERVGKLAVRATLRRGDRELGSAEEALEAFKPLDVGGLPGIDLGGAPVPDGPQLTATARLRDEPAVAGEPNAIVLEATVAEGWHVYGAQEEVGQKTLASLLPAGPERRWVGGGTVVPEGKHLEGAFSIEVPFTPVAEGRVETRARVVWMACTADFCDSTKISYVPVAFDVRPGDADAVRRARDGAGEGAEAAASAGGPGSDGGDDIATMPLFTLILLSIGAGLFALAMPCTYPMIPITISFFAKQAEAREGKVLGLALTYGLGIVLIFTAIGGVVGLTALEGSAVIDFANNAWVNGVLALLFLAFGLSLLGLFELRLPTWFDNLAMKASSGGGLLGVFAMGATLVITSFTCTAPLVGALLVAAGAGGNLARVVLGMGVFGLTMAVPFVFLSMSPGAIQRMPKSGEWMKYLKVTLGIVELGLVLKFVSNIDLQLGTYLIGRELFLALWLSSFAVAGLYLLGLTSLFRSGERWSLTRGRAIAAAVLLGISGFLATGLDGDRLAVKEIEAFLPSLTHEYDEGFAAVVLEDYEAGLEEAQRLGAAVFLHFTGFQ